jgi:hypothetical protein
MTGKSYSKNISTFLARSHLCEKESIPMDNPKTHYFPYKTAVRVTSIINVLFLLGAGIGIFIFWYFTLFKDQSLRIASFIDIMPNIMRFLFPLLAAYLFFMGGLVFVTNTLPILMSRLIITKYGLDYRFWPTYHITCLWSDVDIITRRKEIVVNADILLLKNATELGKPITMAVRKKLGMDTQYFIPLNVLDGWPSGKLSEGLHIHAPQLFSTTNPTD